MEFKQQKQGQQKENWFHFGTWIDMHFFVMTVVIFCVLGAYSLSGEIHILQPTWLKAAGTHKHKYVGFSYTLWQYTYREATIVVLVVAGSL